MSKKGAEIREARRAKIINSDYTPNKRSIGNFGGNPQPVAKRPGKRPQIGRAGRQYLFEYTPNKAIKGKAKTEQFWLNDPRQIFRG